MDTKTTSFPSSFTPAEATLRLRDIFAKVFPTFLWALFFIPFSCIVFPRQWTCQDTYLKVFVCFFNHLFHQQDYLCKPDCGILAECSAVLRWLVSARQQPPVPLPRHPGKLHLETRRCTMPRDSGHLFARDPVCAANLSEPAPHSLWILSSRYMVPHPAPGACICKCHIQ